jgi:transcriptional regulator with XRE-family HTH domain
MSTIGTTIKQQRLKLGISQATLAKRLNVGIESVANWEHSRTIPDIHHLSRIIKFLGYNPLESAKKVD